jgi:hypothetical protein
MSLVEATHKLYRMYQTKNMTNVQFQEKFINLVEVIVHYGGTVGVHKKFTQIIWQNSLVVNILIRTGCTLKSR